jgi:hypothetical protein
MSGTDIWIESGVPFSGGKNLSYMFEERTWRIRWVRSSEMKIPHTFRKVDSKRVISGETPYFLQLPL